MENGDPTLLVNDFGLHQGREASEVTRLRDQVKTRTAGRKTVRTRIFLHAQLSKTRHGRERFGSTLQKGQVEYDGFERPSHHQRETSKYMELIASLTLIYGFLRAGGRTLRHSSLCMG